MKTTKLEWTCGILAGIWLTMLMCGCPIPQPSPNPPIVITTTTTIPPAPAPAPAPVVTDTNEAAHGLDFSTAIQHGQYAFSKVTAQMLSAKVDAGGVTISWINPSTWYYNQYCDGVFGVCWQNHGDTTWNYGYDDWKQSGSGTHTYDNGQLGSLAYYGANIQPDDTLGFFVGSTTGERSNVIFDKSQVTITPKVSVIFNDNITREDRIPESKFKVKH